ncbi:MAG: 16S rRNA (adenine(1518)-N(6)/adenine(1519)-N(6))-dimethyltransferase RsmA [Planctomycetota bacterium]
MTVPRTRNAVQAVLAAHGLAPRRMRGQNFLCDGNLIDAIARDAGVGPEHAVLEVGTGTGILTDALADRAGAVVSCDVDTRLQSMARGLRAWPDTVRFLEADVLRNKRTLEPAVVDAWQKAPGTPIVVSNLPYNIATPFLASLLWSGLPCASMTVLVQKEAAERFTAPVGTADYGPMAIAVALLGEARIVRDVPPQVFWPQPKVDSAVLRIETHDRARAADWAELPALLQRCFLHRRKMLRKSVDAARLEQAGLAADVRPEQVPPAVWPTLLGA